MKRVVLVLAVAALALVASACSSASADQPAPSGSLPPGSVVISAHNIHFDQSQVTAPANAAFALRFDNHDSAPHNVAIYTDSSASTALFQGEVFGGDGSKTYEVPALKPGTHFFRCDVHPDMNGTIVVK